MSTKKKEMESETDNASNSLSLGKIVILIVLLLFSVLTAVALRDHGFVGIFMQELRNFGTMQVLADLVIALSLALVWIWFDSRKTKRLFWPWLLLTLTIGSFGPLLYLLLGKTNQK